MKKRNLHILLLAGLLTASRFQSISQAGFKTIADQQGFQFGFSVKGTLEFGLGKTYPNPNFRLSANAGVASTFLAKCIYPSLNLELQFYNGGFGSGRDNSLFQPKSSLDIILAGTVTAGLSANRFSRRYETELSVRNSPLYYFSNFIQPSLQNPYGYSVSLGSNLVFFTDRKKIICFIE